jgi:hypothetical protein
MKRKISVLFLGILTNYMSAFTQDVITFTWHGETKEKDIGIVVTMEKTFSIDWGDGIIEEYIGQGYSSIRLKHIYPAINIYEVKIAANDYECKFLQFDCSNNQILSIGIADCAFLSALFCSNNQIKNIDLSACTQLQYLFCNNNQLTSLNLNNNQALEELRCQDNQLTNLDVSQKALIKDIYCNNNQLENLDARECATLVYLSCHNNHLTNLNTSGCKKLEYLYCYNNQLTNMDLSSNTVLKNLWCYKNRLPLSNLFAASELLQKQDDKLFGSQTLLPQNAVIETNLFLDQSVFNGIYTNYTITQNGNPAPESDYSITDGKISFHKLGTYQVTMTNNAIVSNIFYPAKVEIELVIVDVGIEENGMLDVIIYPNPTMGELTIDNGELTITNIEIYDVFGRKQSSNHRITSSSHHLINISNLPAGIYFIKVTAQENVYTQKIVKY